MIEVVQEGSISKSGCARGESDWVRVVQEESIDEYCKIVQKVRSIELIDAGGEHERERWCKREVLIIKVVHEGRAIG